MNATIEYEDSVAVIRFQGELTIRNANHVPGLVKQATDNGYRKVLLSMRDVTYLDSTALAVLVALHKQTAEDNVQIALAEANANLHQLLDLTRLNAFLVVFETYEEALRSLQAE